MPLVHNFIFSTEDGDDLFEVEAVVDMRTVRNRREFLVHWKNYSVFVLEQHFCHCVCEQNIRA